MLEAVEDGFACGELSQDVDFGLSSHWWDDICDAGQVQDGWHKDGDYELQAMDAGACDSGWAADWNCAERRNERFAAECGNERFSAERAPEEPAAQPKEEKGFSREFLRAGVEQMTVIREWRSAIENAIRTNNPVEQSWIAGYRSNAESRMAMATASATTDADRQGLPLLQSAMGMVQQLSDRFLALRTTLTYVSPDSLDNDPLDKKILACAQGMASQAIPGGQFQDVPDCH
jgi:hypothetical protein